MLFSFSAEVTVLSQAILSEEATPMSDTLLAMVLLWCSLDDSAENAEQLSQRYFSFG